jgi:cyclopropane-fatty-acyl-phospholipid synthase
VETTITPLSPHGPTDNGRRFPHRFLVNLARQRFNEQVANAGIEINGSRPFDMRVVNDTFYERVISRGAIGVVEAYVDGYWETDQLDELAAKLFSSGINFRLGNVLTRWPYSAGLRLFRSGKHRSTLQVRKRFDLQNDLYQAMLGCSMVYSCASWNGAADLDAAQEAKLARIAQKVNLRPGMRVLDVGCGWGGFAKYAVENYGVSVVGITVIKEQYELGRKMCAGLPIDLRFEDYRDLNDERPFDAIVGIEVLEHVGYSNYRTFMNKMRRLLKPDGLLLLQTVANNTSGLFVDARVRRSIFQTGMLPSARQVAIASEGLLDIEEWNNLSEDYDKTLLAWFKNFDAHWPELRETYGEHFYRMWKYYLLTFADSFRARENQLWQIFFRVRGAPVAPPNRSRRTHSTL